MRKFGKVFAQAAIAAALIGGTVALSATPASARVVCNRFHCWHVYDPYYDGYYDPYYYPSYYGRGVTFGFNFGGGHFHGGHGFHGGSHGHHR